MKIYLHIVLLIFFSNNLLGQYSIRGKVKNSKGKPLAYVKVVVKDFMETETDEKGLFFLRTLPNKIQEITFFQYGFKDTTLSLKLKKDTNITVFLKPISKEIKTITISDNKYDNGFGISKLKDIEGTMIFASKKTEVISLDKVKGNTASSNAREVFSKVSGLTVWESDCSGLQLAIGGRGLSPSRTSNFNTRQNGYNIAADALGYPESYYAPPLDAVERIELVRGSGALQYGSQFGGMLNFVLKKGEVGKKIGGSISQTVGSNRFTNSFVALGGQVNKINHYTFFQQRTSDCFRPNSEISATTFGHRLGIRFSERTKLSFEYTYLNYLAHQAGGLTDAGFEKDPTSSIRERNWFKVNWNLFSASFEHRFSKQSILSAQVFGLLGSRKSVGELGQINRADPLEERNLILGEFHNIGLETRLLKRFKSEAMLRGSFVVGARYYLGETIGQQGLANSEKGPSFDFLNPEDLESSDYRFPSKNAAIFSELVLELSPQMKLIPGLRFENIDTRAIGKYNADVRHPLTGNLLLEVDSSENKSLSRNIALFGLGFSWRFSKKSELYANSTQNYRAVNFNDLRIVNPNFRVDPNIQDEKGFTIDLGLRGEVKNKFVYDVGLFALQYQNKLGLILQVDSQTQNTYQLRTNIADALNLGLESFLEFTVLQMQKNWRLTAFSNLSFTSSTYQKGQIASVEGNRVEYTPQWNVKIGSTLQNKNSGISLQYGYTSEQFSDATNAVLVANATVGIIPSYKVIDISMFHSFKQSQIKAGINNALNESYFTVRATGYPGPGIIPSAFRSVYLTYKFNF